MFSGTTIGRGLTLSCFRSLSSKIPSHCSNGRDTENSQTLRDIMRAKMKELGLPNGATLKEHSAILCKAAKEGKLSKVTIPILGPDCTLEEAQICVSGEWRLEKHYSLLRKAADEGRLVLPQDMPSLKE